MRWAVPLLAAACITELPVLEDPCAAWPDPGLYHLELEPDEGRRVARIYVPEGEGPRDLVVVLHGYGMNGRKMTEVMGWQDAADAFGFAVVSPDGEGWPFKEWNAGPQMGGGPDDVVYLDLLTATARERLCGDRVLATGFSNGAMMGHRWACEGAEVDVLGVAAGPLMVEGCAGDPVPVRHYHGVLDTVVPMEGGRGDSIFDIEFPPVDATMALWRARNGCTADPPLETVDGDTTCWAWSCAVPTELCQVDGWAHLWPGGIHSDATDADATGRLIDFLDVAAPPATP